MPQLHQHHAGRRKSPRITLLLAEESPALRQSLRERLEAHGAVEVIGEAGTTRQALDLFFLLQPRMVLVSICLPGEGGFHVLRCIKRAVPDCEVILSSRWPHPFVQETGRLLGATAVCAMGNGFEEIIEAL
jgi:DNA-binding NarL/FixJ family response regulator